MTINDYNNYNQFVPSKKVPNIKWFVIILLIKIAINKLEGSLFLYISG